MALVDDLGVKVARCTSVIDSAIILIDGIAAKLDELKNDPVKLQAYIDELSADADKLAAKVAENTPAEPPVEQPV